MGNTIIHTNICIIEVPEGEGRKEQEKNIQRNNS